MSDSVVPLNKSLGYQNVYELNELVNVNDRRITFEGSVVVGDKPELLQVPVAK
jgi:hypothetical protein